MSGDRRARLWAALAALAACPPCRADADSHTGFRYDPESRVESARLFGNLNKYAYYFTDLMIGSPPQRVSVIIDTGSRLVGFPCKKCTHCGDHLDPPFDDEGSRSLRWFNCSDQCRETCQDNYCPYKETYAEGSSISGFWFDDMVEIGDKFSQNPPVRARLGCHTSENNLFYTQRANGIMGLAPTTGSASQPTILQQLFSDRKHVNTEIFSICLAVWGGRMTVGGYNESYHDPPGEDTVVWVTMSASHYYFLTPVGMSLGHGDEAAIIGSAADFGVSIVDSGTTYTYLPKDLFGKLMDSLESYCADHDDCAADKDNDECWRLRDADRGPEKFPPLSFDFGAGRPVVWKPATYLHQRGEEGYVCRTFMENSDVFQTVFGISFMLHKDFIFDVGGNKLGIAEANCPEYHEQPKLDIEEKFALGGAWPVAEPRLGSPMGGAAGLPLPRSLPAAALREAVSGRPVLAVPALLACTLAAAAIGAFRSASFRALSRPQATPAEISGFVDVASELEEPGRARPLVGCD